MSSYYEEISDSYYREIYAVIILDMVVVMQRYGWLSRRNMGSCRIETWVGILQDYCRD